MDSFPPPAVTGHTESLILERGLVTGKGRLLDAWFKRGDVFLTLQDFQDAVPACIGAFPPYC